MGEHMKDVFSSIQIMSNDIFDIAIRRIKQLDQMIYPSDVPIRWRQLFESDFAVLISEL
jgi:hypothetical protein